MCGRLACTLSTDRICKACSFKDVKGHKYYTPEWVNSNDQWCYQPSHNVAPTDVTPILVSGKHFPNLTSDPNKPVVHPMIWGMIPPWHKGTYNNHKLTTNNCRLENVMESRLYNGPLQKGQRCVILCDGFYEWQTTKGSQKQPYFIYAPQNESIRVEDQSTWNDSWSEECGWQGPQLLKLAGLFDVWKENTYSYSVITMESNETLNWLHHRMPAVLHEEEAVLNWLEYGKIPARAALELLQPTKHMSWHPVDTMVNNARNKDPRCNKPKASKPKSASSSLMESWLKRGKVKQEGSESDSDNLNKSNFDPSPVKRLKEDECKGD
ncbi:abasic site processing protein HMCES isoform X2 [Hetaerina americana]|uniref:abasic site processing protein HMCES isoform X2 n=1 Tax=Hetaerina americana TaxID=62018 RepID=UPI003A7F2A5F